MEQDSYLRWLAAETPTRWWHDSADPAELAFGLSHAATGVTTNPVLSARALRANRELWAMEIAEIRARVRDPQERAEALMRMVVTKAADMLVPEYERSKGESGYVCAQINPALAGNREAMLAMIRRYHTWAPNVMVKIPATAAGLDVLEEAAAEGIPQAVTVSFTVPQVLAAAERHRRAVRAAAAQGRKAGKCLAVIMIGRIDDYLRDMVRDSKADIREEDILRAGLAITKRAYRLYMERGYETELIVAALRGTYHMTELAGGKLLMSIHPRYQQKLLKKTTPREARIEREIDAGVITRLSSLKEFRRAYEPEGMKPEEFIAFGANQRTLSQFAEIGWNLLAAFDPEVRA